MIQLVRRPRTNRSVALKKKHSKAEDDSKYIGTILGKSNEHGDVLVEGGPFSSILSWEEKLRRESRRAIDSPEPEGDTESRPQSSGLSSLGDRSIGDEMDLF